MGGMAWDNMEVKREIKAEANTFTLHFEDLREGEDIILFISGSIANEGGARAEQQLTLTYTLREVIRKSDSGMKLAEYEGVFTGTWYDADKKKDVEIDSSGNVVHSGSIPTT